MKAVYAWTFNKAIILCIHLLQKNLHLPDQQSHRLICNNFDNPGKTNKGNA